MPGELQRIVRTALNKERNGITVKNDGDVTGAVEQLGRSRNDFVSKLCGFGLSIK